MPKLTEVTPTPPQPPKEAIAATPPESLTLSFTLASGKNAIFRQPMASDLKATEQKPGTMTTTKEGISMTSPSFYRELGRILCIGWGKAQSIPDTIRKDDDEKLITFFVTLLTEQYPANFEAIGSWKELTAQAEENAAGDVFVPRSCTLTNGDILVFRQVLSKDIEQLEKARGLTSIDQYLKLASTACISWGGAAIEWGQSQGRFSKISGEDYVRIYLTLKSF
ncbi:MAG: hypothetical protein PUP93_31105 [Rhizonema sp. NSF051]|nr:hypothetical protein [Rhizonema sp. NSF051]